MAAAWSRRVGRVINLGRNTCPVTARFAHRWGDAAERGTESYVLGNLMTLLDCITITIGQQRDNAKLMRWRKEQMTSAFSLLISAPSTDQHNTTERHLLHTTLCTNATSCPFPPSHRPEWPPFALLCVPLCPGLPSALPWLQRIALGLHLLPPCVLHTASLSPPPGRLCRVSQISACLWPGN